MSGNVRGTVGQVLSIVGTVVGGPAGAVFIVFGAGLQYAEARERQKLAALRARAGRRSEGVRGNIRGTHDEHLLVFGRTRVGGKVLDQETSAGSFTNQNFHVRIAHSLCHAGGCAGIQDFWIDDTRIDSSAISGDVYTGLRDVTVPGYGTGNIQLRHWKGAATQGNDSAMPGDAGASTAKCLGMQSTHFKLIRNTDDEKFRNVYRYGPPVLSVESLGTLLYDPRLDSTMGGSGSYRTNDATTWLSSSENPALMLGTYLIMARSDSGCEVPDLANDAKFWASVAAAANICDETISTPAGNKTRYTGCGVVLSTADGHHVNIQKLLDCMGPMARLVPVDGGASYRLYAGAYRTPTFAIDETWLADEGYEYFSRDTIEGTYNAVRINYDDEALDYKTIEAPPYTSSAYEADDGGKREWKDITLAGGTDPHRVQYIAQQFHKKSRYQALLKLTLNLKGMDLELWESGTISLPGVPEAAGKVWRLAFYEDRGTQIAVAFEEDHSSIYTVDAFITATTSGVSGAANSTPVTPTGLAASPVSTGTLLTWSVGTLWSYDVTEIHRATSSGGTFSKIGEAANGEVNYLDRRTDYSTTLYYKVRTRSARIGLSAFSSEVSSVAGMLERPGSGAQLGDQRNAFMIGTNDIPGLRNTDAVLSSDDPGGGARISIAAHNLQIGSGSISFNSGTITGLSYATTYFVYADDPTFAGGAVTYAATTVAQTVTANSGRYYVGRILTVNNGGGGGGGGSCVTLDAWLLDGVRARDVRCGDLLDCMDETGEFVRFPMGSVERFSDEPCKRIELVGGAAVTVSVSTPLTLEDGRTIRVRDLVPGVHLAASYDGVPRWEPVAKVDDAGRRLVQRIHVAGLSYAAGETPKARIYTHNPDKP